MIYPDLKDASLIAIDTETCDPNLMKLGPGGARGDGYLLGVSVAVAGFNRYYPLRHETGNDDFNQTILWLMEQLSGNQPKIGANILYDLEWLRTEGVEVKGPKYDIQIAEWLLDEDKFSYSLETLNREYLNKGKYELKLLQAADRMGIKHKEIRANLWRMTPDDMGEYAAADAQNTLDIWLLQEPKLKAEELENVFYNVEMPLLDLLLDMRFKGVPVNMDKAEQVRAQLLKKQMAYTLALEEITGNIIDVWSGPDIERNASKLGLPFPLTEKGNPSFEGDWLKSQDHKLWEYISKIRSLDRGGGVFIEKKILEIAKNGRVYPTFRQARNDDGGTRSGRFASANPNMQQVPARDAELAPLIRGLFIPEPGTQWGVFDYSQQEPRTTVHYSHVSNIAGGKEARDKYITNTATDFHQMVADATGLDRTTAKTMNLGLAYGMGKPKMAIELGVSVKEATDIYDKYHANVPFMKALAIKCSNLAETRGYLKTLSGRKRRFELWGPKKWSPGISPKKKADAIVEFEPPVVRYFTYRGMNAVIQGTAADMLKLAMIDVYKAGYVPHLTIHDELDISVETEKQAREIADIMCNCMANHGIEFSVPLKVDIKLGPSWGEARKI